VLDIVEVGAGGGSIAWVDPQGRLHVGPRSAGSEPGPVAFGRGGTETTVTDANLVLGRIGGGRFLGGRLRLDETAATAAIRAQIARPLGYAQGEEARVARGVLDLAGTLMAGAIKEITVARGHDVRDFTLLVFGGGGPIFGTDLAILADVLAALETEASAAAGREFGDTPARLRRQAEMRYRGQRHAVLVDLDGPLEASSLRASFEAVYRSRFGRSLGEDFAPEVVGLRVVAEAAAARPDLSALAPPSGGPDPVPAAHRRLHDGTGWAEAPVWQRAELPAGFRLTGPAIIEEYGSTTLLGPGDEAVVGTLGEIAIRVAPAAEARA
jgi:N-methylhydantoinase A